MTSEGQPANKLIVWIEKHPYLFMGIAVLFTLTILNQIARLFLTKPPSYTPEVIEKIYGKDKVEDYKTVLSDQWLGQKYVPFVEYMEKPRESKFVNVSAQGTRCHYTSREDCIAKGGPKEIWVLGGSTTFGYGVKDDETIAAFIGKEFPEYRVINFGAGGYYSTVELIKFESLLAELSPPRAAIFIDGLNDFYYFGIPSKSMYSDTYALMLDKTNKGDSLGDSLKKRLEKLALYRLFVEKLGHNAQVTATDANEGQLRAAIARLDLNHALIEAIGDKLGIVVLDVIQPVPLYGVGHKTSRVPQELLNFGDHVNSGAAYKIMFAPGTKPPYARPRTLNLAEEQIAEGMYVDTVHYSASFNRKIAQDISTRLSKDLK